MKLPEIAIRNYQFILVIVFIACIVGIYAIQVMPRTEDPDLSLPSFNITAVLPGTSPQDMEELIVKPIEDALEDLDDVVDVITVIDEGIAIFEIEARFGIDYERKLDEISREVNAIRGDLPDNLLELNISQFKPEDVTSIMLITLVSPTASYRELKHHCRRPRASPQSHRWREKDHQRSRTGRGNPHCRRFRAYGNARNLD